MRYTCIYCLICKVQLTSSGARGPRWVVHEVGSQAHSCGSMLPSSESSLEILKHAHGHWPFRSYQTPALMPRSCMRHLEAKLPKLHRRLHQAATLGKAIRTQINSTRGKHTCLVQQPCQCRISACLSMPAQHLLCLQANLRSRLAPTSAGWLHTCKRSGTMQPMPTWAAASLRPTVTARSGGGAACARLGSRTGGKRESKIAQMAPDVPMTMVMQCALAPVWPTTTQKLRQNGTGRPTGIKHLRLWQPVAIWRQRGAAASVGTAGALR